MADDGGSIEGAGFLIRAMKWRGGLIIKFKRACFVTLISLVVGCSWQWHDPAPQDNGSYQQPWRVHCETAQSYVPRPGAGSDTGWLWAENVQGEPIQLHGKLQDGFLVVSDMRTGAGDVTTSTFPASVDSLRAACLDTLRRDNPTAPLELGKVRAARQGEELDVPILLSADSSHAGGRIVIFGDSLSDTGRLKRRLHIFPGEPYWLGRFSNGPIWVDYLEAYSGLAIHNQSYGGAVAAPHPNLPGEELVAMVKHSGQLFVTGSLPLQVSDYIEEYLQQGRVEQPNDTVFIIWFGANDYIWKEPFSGEITTFLNTPQGLEGYERVVNEVIASIETQLKRLYAVGARNFLVLNLPDLGKAPIVLQNTSYFSPFATQSDAARRLELSQRLSMLTHYHNRSLAQSLDRMQLSLPEASISLQDVAESIRAILSSSAAELDTDFDYGFALDANKATLRAGNREEQLQTRCYSGGYLGSDDPGDVCPQQRNALFWDVIHPASFSHCWQAFFVGQQLAAAGWIASMPGLAQHRQWCNAVVQQDSGQADFGSMFIPSL